MTNSKVKDLNVTNRFADHINSPPTTPSTQNAVRKILSMAHEGRLFIYDETLHLKNNLFIYFKEQLVL